MRTRALIFGVIVFGMLTACGTTFGQPSADHGKLPRSCFVNITYPDGSAAQLVVAGTSLCAGIASRVHTQLVNSTANNNSAVPHVATADAPYPGVAECQGTVSSDLILGVSYVATVVDPAKTTVTAAPVVCRALSFSPAP